MERSPRSAGVHARAAASLGQCHTLRSSVIYLVIVIVITVSPAGGFTIRRPENILEPSPDLEAGESTQLEVKYDLRASSENKTVDASKIRVDTDPTVIAINDPKNVDKKRNDNKTFSATSSPVNETVGIQRQSSTETKLELPPVTTKLIPTEVTHLYTTSAISTSQTTTREPDKSQESSTKPTTQTSVVTESHISTHEAQFNQMVDKDTVKDTGIKDDKNETKSLEVQNTSETKATPVNRNVKEEINTKEVHEMTNVTNNLNITDAYKNNSSSRSTPVDAEHKDIEHSITETKSYIKNETADSLFKPDQASAKEESLFTGTDGPLDAFTTVASELETDATNVTFEVPTTEWTTEVVNTETVTTDLNPPTVPSWKKYTTIDRKRTSSEDTTVHGKDMARAETAQTHITLEKALNNTSIPSLEKLKNDLINSQESTTKKLETLKVAETNVSSAPYVEASTQKIGADMKNETTKLEMVSKRAGYKDNRLMTSLKPEEATTSEFPPKVSANDTEMFSSMYETEPSEIEVPDNKNRTVYESQSQLAEDAIKEELLKEETLNDNEENAMRHHDEGSPTSKVKPLKSGKMSDDAVTTQEIVTEDMLSVKPISFDKKKNTILYAVSPNYKPLKKLDVRPQKPFIRDPDDNSWRNESISSLGIVFKPGNASKSLTQVLKNKTEVELGHMTDNKGDGPDLKFRLERITEVRRSKKKNKFGDNVYSDYEESGENAKDTTSPMSPPVESVLAYTPPPPPPTTSKSSSPDFDLTVNAISREKLDFFKNDGTTPLTTSKPKKFYNVAEYYDATDEYDADYVNNHKIELKKFTQPLKLKETSATQPPEVLHTKPMKEYQPERKATVQYFPPTQKVTQKVNLNDYDTDFNRKVNLYTFKEPPKNVLPASFGTVSPIQTERYEQVNKLTVKPAFTPIYKSENWDKNLYLTNQPRVSEPPSGFVANDGNFNRASYVIKHYRDFINEAAKESEDDRSLEYPYTESPLRGVTINELAKMTTLRDNNQAEEEYDYDVKFRKDIMSRFVDNFNQNSERFKVDFPILYNNSVVHRQAPEYGKVASSSAFLKRLYGVGNPRPSNFLMNRKPCEPHCDMTVELSPAYELHYYVPDQEEKEEIEPRPITVPNRYRL